MPHPNLRMLLKHEKEKSDHENKETGHLDLGNAEGHYHYPKTEFN